MVGFMAQKDLTLCSKFTKKTYPEEKVGVHVDMGGKPSIVEYSELPNE
jgi:UDP-N-acetylglucosamine pyrophosphorylase